VRRRTFDRLVSTEGLVLVPVLAVAGGLLSWARRYITGEVHDQLAAQKIYFPASNSPEIAAPEFEAVRQYAGQQLTTGDQAKVYADRFIANHLEALGGGKTYAQLSAAAMALPKGSAAYNAAEAKVQTVFQGTTLRGMLLEAYGFSLLAEIAFWCGIAAFCLAALMAVLVVLGFVHAHRTSDKEELLPSHAPKGTLVSA